MMKASQMFPKLYIAAEDLGDKSFNATISGFGPVAEFDDGDRPVLMFREYKKGLVLKPSIVSVLIWLHGDETDDWTGKQVQLYNELVTFKGKTAPAVRVRGVGSVMGHDAVVPAPATTSNSQSMGPGEEAAAKAKAGPQPMPADATDLDDDIPF
jgi:hypothetical protein